MDDKLAVVLLLLIAFVGGITAGVRLGMWHLFNCCHCRREIKNLLITSHHHEEGPCHTDDRHLHHGNDGIWGGGPPQGQP
jgi:hypothetical protein